MKSPHLLKTPTRRVARPLAAAAAAAATIVALAACAPVTGDVISKEYDDPDPYMTCSMYGSDGACRMWMTNYTSECYRIVVRRDDGSKGKKCLAPHEYEDIAVGDRYEDADG